MILGSPGGFVGCSGHLDLVMPVTELLMTTISKIELKKNPKNLCFFCHVMKTSSSKDLRLGLRINQNSKIRISQDSFFQYNVSLCEIARLGLHTNSSLSR